MELTELQKKKLEYSDIIEELDGAKIILATIQQRANRISMELTIINEVDKKKRLDNGPK